MEYNGIKQDSIHLYEFTLTHAFSPVFIYHSIRWQTQPSRISFNTNCADTWSCATVSFIDSISGVATGQRCDRYCRCCNVSGPSCSLSKPFQTAIATLRHPSHCHYYPECLWQYGKGPPTWCAVAPAVFTMPCFGSCATELHVFACLPYIISSASSSPHLELPLPHQT